MRNTKTSRIGSERERWGLGFARLAADAIGAAIYAPSGSPNGLVTATVETGMDRLALPLAKLQNDVVVKSTAGWDEETGLVVGKRLNSARLAALLVKAQKDPGEIVKDSGWTARYLNKSLWFAIPPQNTKDRARDLLVALYTKELFGNQLRMPVKAKFLLMPPCWTSFWKPPSLGCLLRLGIKLCSVWNALIFLPFPSSPV